MGIRFTDSKNKIKRKKDEREDLRLKNRPFEDGGIKPGSIRIMDEGKIISPWMLSREDMENMFRIPRGSLAGKTKKDQLIKRGREVEELIERTYDELRLPGTPSIIIISRSDLRSWVEFVVNEPGRISMEGMKQLQEFKGSVVVWKFYGIRMIGSENVSDGEILIY